MLLRNKAIIVSAAAGAILGFSGIASAASVPVQSGDTLSGIAASHGVALNALEAANPQISDPNFITVGELVNVPGAGATTTSSSGGDNEVGEAPDGDGPAVQPSTSSGDNEVGEAPDGDESGTASQAPAPQQQAVPAGSPVSAPGGISIPGMPQSLANCIWQRESTSGTNPAANGNQFGIIPASGHNVAGMSVAQQEQVAGQIFAQSGGAAWAADGCPGT